MALRFDEIETVRFAVADEATWPVYGGAPGVCLHRHVSTHRGTMTAIGDELVARPDGQGGLRLEYTTWSNGADAQPVVSRPFGAANVEEYFGQAVAERLNRLMSQS